MVPKTIPFFLVKTALFKIDLRALVLLKFGYIDDILDGGGLRGSSFNYFRLSNVQVLTF